MKESLTKERYFLHCGKKKNLEAGFSFLFGGETPSQK